MAHKAKSKSKSTQTKTAQTKTTQTKTTQKTKESQNTNTIQNGTKDSISYSFTEPIMRVPSDPAAKQPGPRQKVRPSQDTNTKVPLAVFHKRDKKSNVTDIIGAKALTTWKKSSGRNKSWANCKRVRLSRGDLELLVQSKTVPVSLGWRFSTMITPSSFARSHGMRVNSEPKQQRTSKVRDFQDRGPEYGRRRWLRRSQPWKGLGRHQKIESRGGGDGISGPGGFLRITFNREVVSITTYTPLAAITLSTSQLKQSDDEDASHGAANRASEHSEHLVVLRLLRNDSHADVWLVQNSDDRSKFYIAHDFLNDGSSGNWSTFARRKMDRLRRSHSFYAETIQLGRKIIVMQADAKVDKGFHIKNMQREFPPLPGTGKDPAFNYLSMLDIYDADDEYSGCKPAKVVPKQNRISYAAVVGRDRPSKQPLNSNHRAYKAWEDRNGRGKRKDIPSTDTPSHENELSQPAKKTEEFNAWVEVRKIHNIPLCNRFSILSRAVM